MHRPQGSGEPASPGVTSTTPHAVVIGAGLIGISTAYYLRDNGYRVTVLERHPRSAWGTSFANAGVLCPSSTAPRARPGLLAGLMSRSIAAMFTSTSTDSAQSEPIKKVCR